MKFCVDNSLFLISLHLGSAQRFGSNLYLCHDLKYHIRDLIQRVDKNGKSIGDIGCSIAEIWHAIDPGTDDIGGSSGY